MVLIFKSEEFTNDIHHYYYNILKKKFFTHAADTFYYEPLLYVCALPHIYSQIEDLQKHRNCNEVFFESEALSTFTFIRTDNFHKLPNEDRQLLYFAENLCEYMSNEFNLALAMDQWDEEYIKIFKLLIQKRFLKKGEYSNE